jgi:predicted metal-dependent peptidase
MPDLTALDKLARGRAIARKKAPYFSTMIYGLVPVEVPGFGSIFVTKGMVMGYDPDFIKKLTDEEVAGLIVHEGNHVLRKSYERTQATWEHDLANIAADIPINDDEVKAGFALPEGGCFASTYGLPEGKTMEWYYEALEAMRKKDKIPDDAPGGSNGQTGPGAGQCGGVGGNSPNQELEDQLDQQYGRGAADVSGKQKQQAAEIKRHAAGAGRGFGMGNLLQELEALDGPAKIPWNRTLGHVLKKAMTRLAQGATDYSMSRPSNRMFARDDGIIRPGLVAYEPGILLVQDTSGSMADEQIGASWRECIGVVKALRLPSVLYMEADADVTNPPRRVSVRDLHKMQVTGRGGTDFRPAIEHAVKMKPRPDVIVYFTDGDGLAPATPPKGIEVVWCVLPSCYGRKPAAWGKTIFVDRDDTRDIEDPLQVPDEEDDEESL